MLTKDDVRALVNDLLTMEARELLLQRRPDEYYGWVAPTNDSPGYWIGEQALREKRQAIADVEEALRMANLQASVADSTTEHYAALCKQRSELEATLHDLQLSYSALDSKINAAVEARRDFLIAKRAAKLFVDYYSRAVRLPLNVYVPSVPSDLRKYILRQRAKGVNSPLSTVLLYLVVKNTREHALEHQVNAITGESYLANIPLALASLDLEHDESKPSRQRREVMRALAEEKAAEVAHQNHDPRDALADFHYHGLPEQLGALWIDRNENCCQTCEQPLKTRLIFHAGGYRYAVVCSNYRKGCYIEPMTPPKPTRKEAKDYALVEWAVQSTKAA